MRRCIIQLLLVLVPAVCSAADDVLPRSDRDALQQLGLQEEQWQKIDTLVSTSQQRIRALTSEGKRISKDLHRISAGNGGVSRIPRLAGQRAALAADRLKVRAGVRSQLNNILTPAQSVHLRHLLEQDIPAGIYRHSDHGHRSSGAWPSRP